MVETSVAKVPFSKLSTEQRLEEWQIWASKLSGTASPESYGQTWLETKQKFVKERGVVGLSDEERAKFQSLQNKYRGKRIFIIGNGPSLNKTALDKLKGEYTFATNRFYLMYEKIDWRPTFYTCVDRRVVTDIYAEVNGLTGSLFFFDEFFKGLYREGSDVQYFNQRLRKGDKLEESFSFNAANVVFNGNTVLTYAMQIAYYLGFDVVFLIGCDLGYKVLESVSQEGDDVFKMGVGFDLKSTRDDDPNHFDPRYFGQGRLWHAPNEKGMVDDHALCKAAFLSKGRRIYNATVGGQLEVYDRRDFESLFFKYGQQYSRADCAAIDETEVIANLHADDSSSDENFMLDVGACGGGSAANFSRKGWNVLCFEPDPKNRDALTKRFAGSTLVTIDPRAVSDSERFGVPFFSSGESVGISGLSAFRDTHRVAAHVDITTLTKVVEERRISSVQFLKIDVEGFDYSVLRGFPWTEIKPNVIECEFEDKKTKPLGHTTQEVCEFIRSKGYTVYISEWHPIIRYGIQHQWKKIFKFDGQCGLADDAWGNILAFLVDPGYDVLASAISRALRFHRNLSDNGRTDDEPLSIALANRIYRDGDIVRASQAYQELLKRGGIYKSLEFNLGLCLKQL